MLKQIHFKFRTRNYSRKWKFNVHMHILEALSNTVSCAFHKDVQCMESSANRNNPLETKRHARMICTIPEQPESHEHDEEQEHWVGVGKRNCQCLAIDLVSFLFRLLHDDGHKQIFSENKNNHFCSPQVTYRAAIPQHNNVQDTKDDTQVGCQVNFAVRMHNIQALCVYVCISKPCIRIRTWKSFEGQ